MVFVLCFCLRISYLIYVFCVKIPCRFKTSTDTSFLELFLIVLIQITVSSLKTTKTAQTALAIIFYVLFCDANDL